MHYTWHGLARCQQRAIRPEVVDILWNFGEQGHHRGADILYMNHEARQRARRELGRRVFARMEARLNAYLVVSGDGALITAGRRSRRLKF
jgi:hypothetical protein